MDNPKKGIAYANQKIRQYEQRGEEARLRGDWALASKYDFYLTKWADILQHFIHEAHQEGYATEDVAGQTRRRYDAKK